MCSTVNGDLQIQPNSKTTILDLIGEWGPWQRRTVLLIFLCKIPAAFFMACVIFTAPFAKYGEYHCKQPDMGLSPANYTEWINIAHPLNENQEFDFCHVYENRTEVSFDWKQQQAHIQSASNTENCESFVHKSIFDSLVTQFDLVCSRTVLIAVTQFFHLCGVLSGGILATKLLEFLSPRYVMLIGMITQIISGCLTGLVSNLNLHIFFRFLAAVCCALMYTAGIIILADITGGKYRKSVICLFESFWGVGVILLPLIANFLPSWSWTSLYLAISLPTVAYILLWFWIPDSPKWLLAHGEISAAKNCLFYAIRVNKLTSRLPSNFDSFLQLEATTCSKAPKPENWQSLWSTKSQIILMFALHTAWAVDVTNYNGMLLNIRVFGREYLIINTIICGFCEITGVLTAWFIVMNVHRHQFLCSGLFNVFAGLLSFIGFAFPNTLSETTYVALGMTLAMISKIATTCSQAVLFTCTSELVPTTKQKICMFSCVVWARIWLLTAPFIGVLTFWHNLFPLAAFGFIELCGGICSCIIDQIHNRKEQKTDKNANEIFANGESQIITTHM